MAQAQHLLVLMSIVLGLSIRELLVGLAPAARRARTGLRQDWLPVAAALMLLVVMIQFWWYLYGLAASGLWALNFFLFLQVFFRTSLLFLAASAVFAPVGGVADGQPPGAHYLANRAWIYGPMVLFEIANLAESAWRLGTVFHEAHIYQLMFIAVTLLLAISPRPWVHAALIGLVALLFPVYLTLHSLRLA